MSSRQQTEAWRLRLFLGIFVVLCGAMLGYSAHLFAHQSSGPGVDTEVRPLPHHTPKYPGGVTLRFAMVHDVIHERYPVHGRAYYEERNRQTRRLIDMDQAQRGPADKRSAGYFALLDDLGVGLERLGHHEEAVQLMRDKLAEQKNQGLHGKDLYSSYANLGTFLILWQLAEGFDDKAKAKERIRDSIGLVREAVQVYPESHFGREAWQVVIEEFLLALLDEPGLLLRFDMIGNRLNLDVDPSQTRSVSKRRSSTGMTNGFREGSPRDAITLVGADEGWTKAVPFDPRNPVPFDEPTLGIIGMWRYGGGANPHFALALGEIMLRVGQRYIAWCAFERVADLARGMDPAYGEHSRWRQRAIEDQLPVDEVAKLRPRFNDELEHGRRYQREYQDYEARKIKEGASIDDPLFYDAFIAEKGEIASPVGDETFAVTFDPRRSNSYWPKSVPPEAHSSAIACALLGAGLLAFPIALFDFLRARKKAAPAYQNPQGPPLDATAT